MIWVPLGSVFATVRGSEPLMIVEVHTLRKDGEDDTYWLRVPPTTLTCAQGIAWTFGKFPGEYRPLAET